MIDFYLPSDVRQADIIAGEIYKIPSIVLMENASRAAADEAERMSGGNGVFVILAGKGNNGGDGFAAARHLYLRGNRVAVLKTDGDEGYCGDAAVNLRVLRTFECDELKIYNTKQIDEDMIKERLSEADVVLDALLGTGSRGAPRGEAGRLIPLTYGLENILALDIPSGVDPESGAVYEPAIRATATVTFLRPKSGMAFSPALESCGRVIIADIGVPPFKVLPDTPDVRCYDGGDLASLLPKIPSDIHKTQRGSLLIYGGSSVYRGAPLLAARGALRAGAGLVYLAVPDFMAAEASAALPEAIVLPLPSEGMRVNAEAAWSLVSEWLEKCSAAAIGPGVGREAESEAVFRHFWDECSKPLLIDADMLYFFATNFGELKPRQNVLLTPHSGEAARILGVTAAEVDAERARSARRLTEKAGTALLKGRGTIIASGEFLRVIRTGSPSLAVPGSGDVLTGVAGAFMAAGMPIPDAATAGAIAHGLAGEYMEKKNGRRGTLAGEIADAIPVQLL